MIIRLATLATALAVSVVGPVALVSSAMAPLAAVGELLAPAAHADPVDNATAVYVAKVDPAPAGPAITVTLSTGKARVVTPCRVEDGRRCYWQADVRGNGIGQSFVVTGGVRYSVNLSGFVGGAR